jgi:hypothetical protein
MGLLLVFLVMSVSINARKGGSMILRDVPRSNFGVTGMFSCLASSFNAQSEDISPVILRGLWKQLFMFTFDAEKGGGAHDWTLFPDFITACEVCSTLGYAYEYKNELEWSEAWNFIKESIDKKKPVITTWEPPEIHYPWFVLIVGYDEEKLYLHCYKGAFYEYPIDKFKQGWENGKGEQPWLYGAIFTLGDKEQEVDLKEVILHSFRQAIETMNKKEVTFPAVKGKFRDGTFKCGFEAYEELINYLDKERNYSKLDIDKLKVIGGWGNCHEASCEDSKRHNIADYLLYVTSKFSSDKRLHIEGAAQLYREVECLYDNFLIIHPGTTPWSRQGYTHLPSLASEDKNLREEAVKNFGRDIKASAKIMCKILAKEREAINELKKVI